MLRARALCARALARAHAHTREIGQFTGSRQMAGKWPKDGQRTWSDCGQSAWTAFRASARRLYLQFSQSEPILTELEIVPALVPTIAPGLLVMVWAAGACGRPRSQSAETPCVEHMFKTNSREGLRSPFRYISTTRCPMPISRAKAETDRLFLTDKTFSRNLNICSCASKNICAILCPVVITNAAIITKSAVTVKGGR